MNLNNNNNNHKNCGFGKDAAAYLYNELETREKINFETHLAKCDSCAEEIGGFTALRSEIADWKMKSFDILATPVIEIPYEKSAPLIETQPEKISWFDSLKNALIFSPAFATIAAVMILALFGISYLIFNSGGEEYAYNGTANAVVNSPVTVDKKPDFISEETKKSAETDVPEIAKDNESAPEITKTKFLEKPQPVAIVKETPKKVKPVETKRRSNNKIKIEENSPVQAQTKLPKLNTLPDEEEIEELRLSDLLGDADSR